MKKNNLKKILAATLTLALGVATLTGCGSASAKEGSAEQTSSDASATQEQSDSKVYRTLDEIKESGEINIGVFSDKNPFGYVDENGEYQGYDVYFANKLGEDLGVKINFVSTEAASRVEYLETGKVDIVLANFTVTEERAEKVDFAVDRKNISLY